MTTGGEPAGYIVEKHLARFSKAAIRPEYENIWDQMYFSDQCYGRIRASALDRLGFGLALNRDIALHRPYTH